MVCKDALHICLAKYNTSLVVSWVSQTRAEVRTDLGTWGLVEGRAEIIHYNSNHQGQ